MLIDLKIIIVEATQKKVDLYTQQHPFSCHCVYFFVDDDVVDDSGSSAPFGAAAAPVPTTTKLMGPNENGKLFGVICWASSLTWTHLVSKRKREFRHPAPHTREKRSDERNEEEKHTHSIHFHIHKPEWFCQRKLYVKQKYTMKRMSSSSSLLQKMFASRVQYIRIALYKRKFEQGPKICVRLRGMKTTQLDRRESCMEEEKLIRAFRIYISVVKYTNTRIQRWQKKSKMALSTWHVLCTQPKLRCYS